MTTIESFNTILENYRNNHGKAAGIRKISILLETAEEALAEAADIAREAGVDFGWAGPTYGMGGGFDHERTQDAWGNESNGWRSSTEYCN